MSDAPDGGSSEQGQGQILLHVFGRTDVGQIREHTQVLARRIFFEDQRSDRHLDLKVLGGLPGPVAALPVRTAPGFELGMKAEIDEGVLAGRGDDVDGAAVAAIASVGTAPRDELLTTEAGASVAAPAGFDL